MPHGTSVVDLGRQSALSKKCIPSTWKTCDNCEVNTRIVFAKKVCDFVMGIVKHFGKFLPSLVASLGSEARRKLKLLSSRHELPVFLTLRFSFASQDPQSRSAKRRTSRRLLQSGEQSLGDVSKRVSPSETKEGGHANMTKESSESSRPKASTHTEGEERLGALRIHLADLLIEDSNDHEAARTFLQK